MLLEVAIDIDILKQELFIIKIKIKSIPIQLNSRKWYKTDSVIQLQQDEVYSDSMMK
jgi:hypothetical protein